ncbi:MAG: carbohydrate kinase family protein [Lachnospiraceae bacterium]|nr:carbohydrate kinase family protein [Lachnospiraceae bacterium]
MKEYDIICIGTALVDSIIKGFDPEPVSATGYRADSGSLNVGGEAVNAGMAAAKLGMKTGLLCSLGKDAAGDMIVSALERCGVDTELILRSEEHPTPVTTMFVREDGTRRSITNEAHRYNFHPERYSERFSGARALLLGSLFRAPFNDPEIVRSVLCTAKEAGALVFADTKLPNFRVLSLADLADSLPLIDYLTPNEDEARYYSGKEEPEEMADLFLERGVKNVIIKLGAAGCLFKNAETTIRLPAFSVRAVDATGAGDNLIAGFAAEILRGAGVREALLFANACGAICTTAIGAGSALKDAAQVRAFLEREKAGTETEKKTD